MEYLMHHNDRLDYPIYPGHPITLAVQIARAFPSLAAASQETVWGCAAALASDAVSGAGGSVYTALYALYRLSQGEPLDYILEWSDSCSEEAYHEDWPAACAQARRYLATTDLVGWAAQEGQGYVPR